MTGPPILRTPRLTVRPITEADLEVVAELFADPEMRRFLNLEEITQAAIRERAAQPGRWVLDLAGEIAGIGRLQPSTELPGDVLEIGYYVARRHWGKGLATEAVRAMLRHAFDTLAAPAVFALVHEHNAASAALVARLGFVNVGTGQHYGASHHVHVAFPQSTGQLHHVELWVPDLLATQRSWGWLLTELGWTGYQRWEHGVSWRLGRTYLVFEDSPARRDAEHDRLRPGLNHIALHAGTPDRVDALTKTAKEHGWRLMFADRHPYAGGPDHYAAYLENADGYEVELVATDP